jgi:hypothetical protein
MLSRGHTLGKRSVNTRRNDRSPSPNVWQRRSSLFSDSEMAIRRGSVSASSDSSQSDTESNEMSSDSEYSSWDCTDSSADQTPDSDSEVVQPPTTKSSRPFAVRLTESQRNKAVELYTLLTEKHGLKRSLALDRTASFARVSVRTIRRLLQPKEVVTKPRSEFVRRGAPRRLTREQEQLLYETAIKDPEGS